MLNVTERWRTLPNLSLEFTMIENTVQHNIHFENCLRAVKRNKSLRFVFLPCVAFGDEEEVGVITLRCTTTTASQTAILPFDWFRNHYLLFVILRQESRICSVPLNHRRKPKWQVPISKREINPEELNKIFYLSILHSLIDRCPVHVRVTDTDFCLVKNTVWMKFNNGVRNVHNQ